MSFVGVNTIYGVHREHSTPYLTRAWVGRLHLHIFHRGDADPDCHNHPADFWTFPLTSYVEEVAVSVPDGREHFRLTRQVVPSFRLSFRPAEHTHRVLGRWRGLCLHDWIGRQRGDAPIPQYEYGKIITIVWKGRQRRKWGFLKSRDGRWCWTPWKEYVFGGGKHAPCEDERGALE